MIRLTIILLILSIVLTSLTSKQDNITTDFPGEVESFVKKYSADFTSVNEFYSSDCNDMVLDKKAKSSWSKNVTLKSKKTFKNNNNQTVYQRLFLGFYQYNTDLECSAALDSILQCFGNDCDQLVWGDNGNKLKTTPRMYLINEREIIVCKIHCEHTNEFWTTFKNDLKTTFGKGAYKVIDAGCGGQVNFSNF